MSLQDKPGAEQTPPGSSTLGRTAAQPPLGSHTTRTALQLHLHNRAASNTPVLLQSQTWGRSSLVAARVGFEQPC